MTTEASGPDPRSMGYRLAHDLGNALLDGHGTMQAIPYLDRAVALQPNSYDLVRLGGALRDVGRFDEAIERQQEAMSFERPGEVDTFARTALSAALADRAGRSDLTRALEIIGTVLERDPENEKALWTAYKICKKLSRLPDCESFAAGAEEFKARAKAADPRSAEDRQQQQRLRAVRGQRLQAELAVTLPLPAPQPPSLPEARATESQPKRPGLLQRLGRLLLRAHVSKPFRSGWRSDHNGQIRHPPA